MATRMLKPDWVAIKAALQAMVTDVMPLVTGDANEATDEDDLPIYWSKDEQGLPVGRTYWVELSIRSSRDVGMAEVRKSDHPTPTPGAERQVIVTTPSTFVLSIKVPSNIQSADSPQSSRSIVSAIRLALAAPEYVQAFDQAGFAFSRVLRDIADVPDMRSGRDRSYSVLDLQFNTASAFEARPGTTIETFVVAGKLDGASLPAQEFA